MPTRAVSATCDVRAEMHAREIYARRRVVGSPSRRLDGLADADDVEDPAAVRDEPPAVECRPRMEDERTGRLRSFHAFDRGAAVSALRVLVPGDYDRDRCALRHLELGAKVAGEQRQQIAIQPGQEGLRLGVAEAAVELDHPQAVLGA